MSLLALACQAIDQKLHLRSMTSEYEILLLLYDLNVASPYDLLKLQQSSNSTFYKNIGYLQQKGLIKIERDGRDRRHSLYSLTDFARDGREVGDDSGLDERASVGQDPGAVGALKPPGWRTRSRARGRRRTPAPFSLSLRRRLQAASVAERA
jgi:hypothetical protein